MSKELILNETRESLKPLQQDITKIWSGINNIQDQTDIIQMFNKFSLQN